MKNAAHIVLIFLIFSSLSSFAQFEQKLTINGSGAFVYPDFGEEFSSYSNGFGIEGGLQYNVNRTFSLYSNARFYYLFGSSSYSEAYYDNIALSGGIKINLLPNFIINPYLYGEANVNFIWLDEYDYISELFISDYGTSIGSLGGAGFDIVLNENFALFVQSGLYYTYWDNRSNLFSQLGARINLIKSKTL